MLKNIWDFFQNEVLGMKWLNRLIGSGLEVAGLNTSGRVGGSIQFFIYDTIKIMLLLGFLILIISYIQSYFPPERTKKILGRLKGIWANIIAALLGTVTPFCSCSSIPLFIGFTSAGLPLGVTFSFLISSPMVDLGSLVLLMSIFGWKVAIVYVVVGLVIAVVGGTLIEKMHFENQPAMSGQSARLRWKQTVFISISLMKSSKFMATCCALSRPSQWNIFHPDRQSIRK